MSDELDDRMYHSIRRAMLDVMTSTVSGPHYDDGVPCSHPGCLSHVSHPCEGCGRIGGMSERRRVGERSEWGLSPMNRVIPISNAMGAGMDIVTSEFVPDGSVYVVRRTTLGGFRNAAPMIIASPATSRAISSGLGNAGDVVKRVFGVRVAVFVFELAIFCALVASFLAG